ncbi:hypothetical protein KY331_02905 [Candidatus Woesearchaeota archaeon]|nr:hypothetical protein [Candidatus Woesearchaeota archaeon]
MVKLLFDAEDCIVGIIFSLLIIALSGKWFKIPYVWNLLLIVIPILAVFIIFDLISEFADLGRHFLFIGLSILHNIFDLILGVGFYALYFKLQIPLISFIVPYLSNNTFLFWLGAVEVVIHIVWIVLTPFNQ